MATFTANYNLRKPAGGDLVTVAADINASMDIIDAEMFEHEGRLDVLEALNPELNIWKLKTADESVTSSTAMQNDNHLLSGTLQPGTYLFDVYIFYTGAEAGDISIQYTFTGTMNIHGFNHGSPTGATTVAEYLRNETQVTDSVSPFNASNFGAVAGSVITIHSHFVAEVTVAGAITLQWAQNVSNATATTVKQGSHMRAQKVA